MNTLRASAFLSWLVALLGLALRYDAQSSAPGGHLGSPRLDAAVGLGIACMFAVLAIGIHVLEFFQRKKRGSLDE